MLSIITLLLLVPISLNNLLTVIEKYSAYQEQKKLDNQIEINSIEDVYELE